MHRTYKPGLRAVGLLKNKVDTVWWKNLITYNLVCIFLANRKTLIQLVFVPKSFNLYVLFLGESIANGKSEEEYFLDFYNKLKLDKSEVDESSYSKIPKFYFKVSAVCQMKC